LKYNRNRAGDWRNRVGNSRNRVGDSRNHVGDWRNRPGDRPLPVIKLVRTERSDGTL
jgi:hypothetical protein